VIAAEDIPETSRILGQTVEETRDIIAKGHAPMAEGVILIDFDGTIAPFGPLFEAPEPLPGAIEAIRAFKAAGMKVIIFTSRLSPLWLDSVGQSAFQHVDYITKYLDRFGITPDGFTAQKVPAIAMIDDKAYRYDNNWDELRRIILDGR
jgi:hypothetical protein